jgi:hypothetical protein
MARPSSWSRCPSDRLMLRIVVLVVALIALLAIVICSTAGWGTLPLAMAPGLVLFGLLFERYIYKPVRPDKPGAGWERTPERFLDPSSGQTIVVYYDRRTGERRYVREASPESCL